ncbi:MAG TPA: ERAP1-like C-terminal domain-containing protein, partial [Thermodesulfobacteriota bacterium]|nr:ERAP1-like C-terminal domain-containing protein [Thermodesulfobacteriota bacterium]
LEAFEGDTDRLIVEEIAGQYSRLTLLLPRHERLAGRAGRFFAAHLQRIGEKKGEEAENISILRGMLSRERSIVDREFASRLSERFPRFHETDPDIRGAVALSEALVHNDFSALRGLLTGSKSDEDRSKLIAAMGWLEGDENLSRAIDLIRTEEIKKQDTYLFYGAVSANPGGRGFMTRNLAFAVKQLTSDFADTGMPSRVLEGVIPLLGIGREKEILDLLDTLRSPEIETGVRKGTEILRIYSKFAARNAAA